MLELDPNLSDAYYRVGQAEVHPGRKDLADREFAARQKFHKCHLADDDRERVQIRQFVLSMEGGQTSPQWLGSRP